MISPALYKHVYPIWEENLTTETHECNMWCKPEILLHMKICEACGLKTTPEGEKD